MSAPTEGAVPVTRQKSKNWLGIAAVLLGLTSIALISIDFDRLGLMWLGLILVVSLSLGAVVLGRRGIRAKEDGEASQRQPASFGRVLGWIGLGLAAMTVLYFAFFLIVMVSAGA